MGTISAPFKTLMLPNDSIKTTKKFTLEKDVL
jgi:hypothetical protein